MLTTVATYGSFVLWIEIVGYLNIRDLLRTLCTTRDIYASSQKALTHYSAISVAVHTAINIEHTPFPAVPTQFPNKPLRNLLQTAQRAFKINHYGIQDAFFMERPKDVVREFRDLWRTFDDSTLKYFQRAFRGSYSHPEIPYRPGIYPWWARRYILSQPVVPMQ